MPFFWAAYRMGAFEDILAKLSEHSGIDVTNPTREEFPEVITAWFSLGDFWVLTGKTQRGINPIGVVETAHFFDAIIPYARWFPWASPRAKLESAAKFLDDMRKTCVVLIYSEYDVDPETNEAGPQEKFFCKLAFLGLIAKGCRIEGLFNGRTASLWKSVR